MDQIIKALEIFEPLMDDRQASLARALQTGIFTDEDRVLLDNAVEKMDRDSMSQFLGGMACLMAADPHRVKSEAASGILLAAWENPSLFKVLGLIDVDARLNQFDQLNRAIECFELAIDRDATNPAPEYGLALVRVELNQPDMAEAALIESEFKLSQRSDLEEVKFSMINHAIVKLFNTIHNIKNNLDNTGLTPGTGT